MARLSRVFRLLFTSDVTRRGQADVAFAVAYIVRLICENCAEQVRCCGCRVTHTTLPHLLPPYWFGWTVPPLLPFLPPPHPPIPVDTPHYPTPPLHIFIVNPIRTFHSWIVCSCYPTPMPFTPCHTLPCLGLPHHTHFPSPCPFRLPIAHPIPCYSHTTPFPIYTCRFCPRVPFGGGPLTARDPHYRPQAGLNPASHPRPSTPHLQHPPAPRPTLYSPAPGQLDPVVQSPLTLPSPLYWTILFIVVDIIV